MYCTVVAQLMVKSINHPMTAGPIGSNRKKPGNYRRQSNSSLAITREECKFCCKGHRATRSVFEARSMPWTVVVSHSASHDIWPECTRWWWWWWVAWTTSSHNSGSPQAMTARHLSFCATIMRLSVEPEASEVLRSCFWTFGPAAELMHEGEGVAMITCVYWFISIRAWLLVPFVGINCLVWTYQVSTH